MKEYHDQMERWLEESKIPKWKKEGYLDNIKNSYVKMVTSLMLENQSLANSVFEKEKIVDRSLELVSKIVPNLAAHQIVSVQPKLGPNSIVYYNQSSYVDGEIKQTIMQEDMVSKTRLLKTYQDPVEDVDEISKKIVDEINNEILTDLWNNALTSTEVKEDDWEEVYEKIFAVRANICKKTLRCIEDWIVVSPNTQNRFEKAFDSLKRMCKVITVDTMPDNRILVGQKGGTILDSSYIWSPYVMLGQLKSMSGPRFVIRYGKKLIRNGGKSFGKVTVPTEKIDFSSFTVKCHVSK